MPLGPCVVRILVKTTTKGVKEQTQARFIIHSASIHSEGSLFLEESYLFAEDVVGLL